MCRYFINLAILILLSGCYQTSSSLVGPVYTLGSSGNISHAVASYGFNAAVETNTGKSTINYAKDYFEIEKYKKIPKDETKYTKVDQKKLYDLVKTNLEKTKKILSD